MRPESARADEAAAVETCDECGRPLVTADEDREHAGECPACDEVVRCVTIGGESYAMPEHERRYARGREFAGEQCDDCGCDEFTITDEGVRCTAAHYDDESEDRKGCGRVFPFERKAARLCVWGV